MLEDLDGFPDGRSTHAEHGCKLIFGRDALIYPEGTGGDEMFYLIHDLIIRGVKGVFMYCQISANTALTATTITVILFVLTQIVSIWLLKTVELPVQKYLRSLARRKNPA